MFGELQNFTAAHFSIEAQRAARSKSQSDIAANRA